MSDFSNFMALSINADGRWILVAPMPFDLIYGDPTTRITVPSGFVTDGATIPVLARSFFDRGDSRIFKAAILHDYMLTARNELGARLFTPRQSADAFRSAMLAAAVSKWSVKLMWLAVLIWTSRPSKT